MMATEHYKRKTIATVIHSVSHDFLTNHDVGMAGKPRVGSNLCLEEKEVSGRRKEVATWVSTNGEAFGHGV